MSDKRRQTKHVRKIMRQMFARETEIRAQPFLTTQSHINALAAQGIDIKDVVRLGGYDGYRVIDLGSRLP